MSVVDHVLHAGDFDGMQLHIEEEDVVTVSAPVSAVNWDDRLDMWEGEEIPPRHQHQHHDGEPPLVERRALYSNHPLRNNLPRPHAAYLFRGEDPHHQLARRQRFVLFREKRKQVLIGLSILAATLLINFIVVIMFSVALAAPQFTFINTNGTRINVFLWGEGAGTVFDELDPLPRCMGRWYRSVLSNTIASYVLAVLALLFTVMSCSCATNPWRFARSLLLLGSSISGSFATYLVIIQHGIGCDGEMRWHRAGPGSLDLLVGTIFCFVVSLASFAQVSRYPLREVPSWALLVGDYVDDGEPEAEVGVLGAPPPREVGGGRLDGGQTEDEEMRVSAAA